MKKILFPTDFSNAAHGAFMYALKFADKFDAQITIMHVYDIPVIDVYPLNQPATDVYEIVEVNHQENFNEELQKLQDIAQRSNMGHIIMQNLMLYGDLNYNIKTVAQQQQIDFIIMGTNGTSGLSETFIGSMASSVVKNTVLPVLAIPFNSVYHDIKKIAFTTQYNDRDNAALEKAIGMAQKLQASIQCLNVANRNDIQGVEDKIAEFEMYYRDNDIDFVSIEGEDTEQAIFDFIERENIDLLIMRTHKHGFFEGLFHSSLTKKITHHTKIPLLIYHED